MPGMELTNPSGGRGNDGQCRLGQAPKEGRRRAESGSARETVSGEYRNQVETYYRVIAERSKKP
jgi:hypothetical protein